MLHNLTALHLAPLPRACWWIAQLHRPHAHASAALIARILGLR